MARRLAFAALAPVLLMGMGMALVVPPACAVGGVGAQESHHLHFYMHDSSADPNPSAVLVARGTGPPVRGSVDQRFGDMRVMDDVLTEGATPASKALGRSQGFYVVVSSTGGSGSNPAVLISMNVLLTGGPYNGSTLAITGRNAVLAPVRELSVVGGTGRFRIATGYVLMKTASWRGNAAVLELDVYVSA